jgi:hypothetical protein
MITKKKKVFFSKKDRRYFETELSIIWTNILDTFLHRKSPKKVYKHLTFSSIRKKWLDYKNIVVENSKSSIFRD